MMESTKLLDALEDLREQYEKPTSYMEIAQNAVLQQLARKNKVEMPAILDEKQRKVFMDNIDHMAGFLASEAGANAIEILMDTHKHYCDQMKNQQPEQDDDDEGM